LIPNSCNQTRQYPEDQERLHLVDGVQMSTVDLYAHAQAVSAHGHKWGMLLREKLYLEVNVDFNAATGVFPSSKTILTKQTLAEMISRFAIRRRTKERRVIPNFRLPHWFAPWAEE